MDNFFNQPILLTLHVSFLPLFFPSCHILTQADVYDLYSSAIALSISTTPSCWPSGMNLLIISKAPLGPSLSQRLQMIMIKPAHRITPNPILRQPRGYSCHESDRLKTAVHAESDLPARKDRFQAQRLCSRFLGD